MEWGDSLLGYKMYLSEISSPMITVVEYGWCWLGERVVKIFFDLSPEPLMGCLLKPSEPNFVTPTSGNHQSKTTPVCDKIILDTQ